MSPKLSKKQLKRRAKYNQSYTTRDTEFSQHIAKHKGLNDQIQNVNVRIAPPESARNTNLEICFPISDQDESNSNRFAATKKRDNYEDIKSHKDSNE